jgi:hypothetical protein
MSVDAANIIDQGWHSFSPCAVAWFLHIDLLDTLYVEDQGPSVPLSSRDQACLYHTSFPEGKLASSHPTLVRNGWNKLSSTLWSSGPLAVLCSHRSKRSGNDYVISHIRRFGADVHSLLQGFVSSTALVFRQLKHILVRRIPTFLHGC